MTMDVLMLVYDEPQWEENYQQARRVLGEVKLIKGSPNMVESFRKCAAASSTDLMVMIDGDTFVLPQAVRELEKITEPTIFFSSNVYGIRYGHGGIKVIPRESTFSGLAVDVTERLALPATPVVISRHDFHKSPSHHWKAVFKELVKLRLWGNSDLFGFWMAHAIPASIYHNSVIPFLSTATMEEVSALLENNVGLDSLFQRACVMGYDGMFAILHVGDHPTDVIGF